MLQLFLGAFCISFSPIVVKAIDMGPTMIAVYRSGLALFFLIFILWYLHRRKPFSFSKRFWMYAAGSGFFLAIDLYAWHRSIAYIGPGLATLLGNTQIFYSAAYGAIVNKESLKPLHFLAIGIAFVGVYLAVGERPEWVSPSEHIPGVLFGLLTGLVYGGFMILLKKWQNSGAKNDPPAIGTLAGFNAFVVLFLIPVCAVEESFTLPTMEQLSYFMILALLIQILGWLLISRGIKFVPYSIAGLIMLAQPALAVIWGALIYKELLGFAQASGVVLVLTGIYLGTLASRPKKRPLSQI